MKTFAKTIFWQFLLWVLPISAQAQFTFTTNNGAITITGYTVYDGNVVIPATINGYPVTVLGTNAFSQNGIIKTVTIPNSVTNINIRAFANCSGLTNITVDAANPNYASVGGVLFNNTLTSLIQYPGGLAGNYVIPNSVTNVGFEALAYCSVLTNVTISSSVASFGAWVFLYCDNLHQVYFQGNAPSANGVAGSVDSTTFYGDTGTA